MDGCGHRFRVFCSEDLDTPIPVIGRMAGSACGTRPPAPAHMAVVARMTRWLMVFLIIFRKGWKDMKACTAAFRSLQASPKPEAGGSVDRTRPLQVILLASAVASLSACQSENQAVSDDLQDTTPQDPVTTGSLLSSYYVENFDAFRDAALDLIQTDPRYLLQVADGTFYVDRNGNGQFDEGVDVRLLSDPIRHAGVHYAHASGLTGAGQVIAFSDNGYLSSHEVFEGKQVTNQSTEPTAGHGTAVASIGAGSSASMIGVAPGADIIIGDFATYEALGRTAREAARQDAVALNNSWGFTSLEASQASYDSFASGSGSGAYLDALRSYSQQGVVLFAASNDFNAGKAGFLEVLPVFDPDLEAGWLSVINGVPVMVDDDIVSAQRVSSGCLEAAKWCLAADGTWTTAWSDSVQDYQFGTGTSYATPVVSGALALLAEAFPEFSPHDLKIRLLASADNQFDGFTKTGTVELVDGFSHDISDEWGHGFVDVKAALMPIGEAAVPLADGSTQTMSQPTLVGGGAYGDAPIVALSGTNIAVQDALDAQFTVDASALVASRKARPLLPTETRRRPLTHAPECCAQSAFLEKTAPVSMSAGTLRFQLNLPEDPNGRNAFGLEMTSQSRQSWGDMNVSLGVGSDGGAFSFADGMDAGAFISAGFALKSQLSKATTFSFEAGLAQLSDNGGSAGAANVRLGHAHASFERRNLVRPGDRIELAVGLPVAVVSGQTSLTLPVARSVSGYEFETIEVDLAPDEREVRLDISYGVDLSDNTFGTISVHHALNRGNVAGEVESGMFIGIRTSF